MAVCRLQQDAQAKALLAAQGVYLSALSPRDEGRCVRVT